MKLIFALTLCLLLAGCASRDTVGPAAGNGSAGGPPAGESLPVGDAEERLAVAARLRRELRDRQVEVIVNGTKLLVTYRSGSAADAAEEFLQEQGKAGMARLANAGFETLIVSARGQTETKEIPVAPYRTR